jgi:RecA/RadA recombinase
MAQPLKKKEVKQKPTLASFKEKMGLTGMKASSADKELEWLLMPQAFKDVLKLPGIPMGYVTTIMGHSNTGKSTLINHAIVAAQKKGIIPVIYDTENNFDFTYAISMGMDAQPVYGDIINEETGEVEYGIVEYEGNFIYFNNKRLAERYGIHDHLKGVDLSKPRKDAVLEDIAYSMREFLEAQDNGDICAGFLFIWDSIGSIISQKSLNSKVGNHMFDAASISEAFTDLLNNKIPSSRKVSEPYTNTMIVVNKVWMDSMTNPVGPPSIKQKGGNTFVYAQRLSILMGGQLGPSIKKLTAVSKGLTYQYATQTKIKVMKNQLPAPFTLTFDGELVCTPTGFIAADKDTLDQYRKEHVSDFIKQLNELADNANAVTNESDISFTEIESND